MIKRWIKRFAYGAAANFAWRKFKEWRGDDQSGSRSRNGSRSKGRSKGRSSNRSLVPGRR